MVVSAFNIQKYDVVVCDLPEQPATQRGENGRPLTVVGSEQHGDRPCVVVSVLENGSGAIVVPLTSTKTATGRDKTPQKTWLRVIRNGAPSFAMVEQIRYAARERITVAEEDDYLGEYDRAQLETRLRMLLGLP